MESPRKPRRNEIMNFKRLKVYHYFWLTSLLIFMIGFYIQNLPDSTLDINIHDTYYVIEQIHLTILIAVFYFLTGCGYWFVEKILKKKLFNILTIIHCVILFGSFICYWLVYLYSKLFPSKPFPLFDNYGLINKTLLISFLLIVFIGLPIYFINLLIGIFRKSAIR